jgi:hypothetical protein
MGCLLVDISDLLKEHISKCTDIRIDRVYTADIETHLTSGDRILIMPRSVSHKKISRGITECEIRVEVALVALVDEDRTSLDRCMESVEAIQNHVMDSTLGGLYKCQSVAQDVAYVPELIDQRSIFASVFTAVFIASLRHDES